MPTTGHPTASRRLRLSPRRSLVRRALAASSALALNGCAQTGTLDPRGIDADVAAGIWWYMFWLSAAIFVGWLGLFVVGMLRKHPEDADDDRDQRLHRRLIVGGGIVVPTLALGSLLVYNLIAVNELPRGSEVVVDATGYQFWWEFTYDDSELVTANELYIPTDTDVRVRLHTEDVIHSFWVPQLSGKRDMIPGRVNALDLHAREPGRYLGECTEFCGIQHANMRFEVVAVTPQEYEQWLARMEQPAAEPSGAAEQRGYETFMNASCASCHAIGGTPADGQVGPELTHFASRRWLGAGAAPNDRGHLGAWVANSQGLKPGNLMPPVEINAEDLPDLLTYLESLE